MLWPDVRRTAFASGSNSSLNACVGWALSRRSLAQGAYSRGYRTAAESLLATVQCGGMSPDIAVWPLAFLWRHHVELSLKEVIWHGCMLEEVPLKVPGHHNLTELWRLALPAISRAGDDPAALTNVGAILEEISSLDPTAAGFRYPFECDHRTESLKVPPNLVNLSSIDEAMRSVADFLDCVQSVLAQQLEALCEEKAKLEEERHK